MSTAASPVTQTRTKFVPPFLAKLGLQPGEWMYASKLTLRALTRPSWPLKVRIWAFLTAQSFGYESDLAVYMRKANRPGGLPKVAPILPHEIIQGLNRAAMEAFKESKVSLTEEQQEAIRISRQHMRRALAEMDEEDGLITRVRINRCGPPPAAGHTDNRPFWDLSGMSIQEAVTAGAVTPIASLPVKAARTVQRKICVYLLARPRPAKNLADVANLDLSTKTTVDSKGVNRTSPAQLILPFLTGNERGKVTEIADDPEVRQLLLQLRSAIDRRIAELKASNDPLTGRKPGETGSVPNPILRAEPPNTRHSAPPVHEAASGNVNNRPQPPVIPSRPAASPVSAVANPKRSGRLDEQTPADEDQRTQRPVAPAIAESIPEADVSLVLPAMRKYCVNGVSRNMARELIRACRAHDRHATCATIIAAIDAKGPSILAHPKIYNPPAVLVKCVPELFEGGLSAAPIRKRDESTWGPLSDPELAEMERGSE